MPYSHYLHPLAHQDIIDAYEWYEKEQIGLGDRFALAVTNKILEIVTTPLVFGAKSNRSFREASVGAFPFIIVYRVYPDKNEIVIASIHHAKKHPKRKYRK
jgi:plasmid stabilization system protein ParE